MCHGTSVEVKGQLQGVGSLPPCGSSGLNANCQALCQVHFPAEPSWRDFCISYGSVSSSFFFVSTISLCSQKLLMVLHLGIVVYAYNASTWDTEAREASRAKSWQ